MLWIFHVGLTAPPLQPRGMLHPAHSCPGGMHLGLQLYIPMTTVSGKWSVLTRYLWDWSSKDFKSNRHEKGSLAWILIENLKLMDVLTTLFSLILFHDFLKWNNLCREKNEVFPNILLSIINKIALIKSAATLHYYVIAKYS